MEIFYYNFSEYKLYNPVKGDVIVDIECDDPINFLENYKNADWKVLEVTSSGISCGPVSSIN